MKKKVGILIIMLMLVQFLPNAYVIAQAQEQFELDKVIPNDESGIPDSELYKILDTNDDGKVTKRDGNRLNGKLEINSKVTNYKGLENFYGVDYIEIDAKDKNRINISNLSSSRVLIRNVNQNLKIDKIENSPNICNINIEGLYNGDIYPYIDLSFLNEQITTLSLSQVLINYSDLNMRLSQESNISTLYLYDVLDINNAYLIMSTSKLEELHFYNKNIIGIEQVIPSDTIKKITLSNSDRVKKINLDGIEKFKSLEILVLSNIDQEGLDKISYLDKLFFLEVDNLDTKVKKLNIDNLGLLNLRTLIISNCEELEIGDINNKENLYFKVSGKIKKIGKVKGVKDSYISINTDDQIESLGKVKDLGSTTYTVYASSIENNSEGMVEFEGIENLVNNSFVAFNSLYKDSIKINKIKSITDINGSLVSINGTKIDNIENIDKIYRTSLYLNNNELENVDAMKDYTSISNSSLYFYNNKIDINNNLIDLLSKLQRDGNRIDVADQRIEINPNIDYTKNNIQVLDKDFGIPLTNANISLSGNNYTTGEYGLSQYPSFEGGNVLTVTKDGYTPYHEKIKSSSGIKYVYLGRDNGQPLTITSASLKRVGTSKDKNVLYESVLFDESETLSNECELNVYASWKEYPPTKYSLLVGDEVVQTSTDGVFKFNASKVLKENTPVYIKVETENKDISTKEALNMKIYHVDKEGTVSFGKDTSTKVENDVALLGDQEFSMSFGNIKCSFGTNKDDGTIDVLFGVQTSNNTVQDMMKKLDDNYDKLTTAEDIGKFKNILSSGSDSTTIPIKRFLNLDKVFSPKADAIGKMRFKVIGDELVDVSGKLKAKGELSWGGNIQYMIGPIPTYVQLKAGIGLGADGEFSMWNDKRFLPFKSFKYSGNINPGAGVGIPSLFAAEISGKLELAYDIDGSNKNQTDIYANGEAQFKLKALIFEYVKKFADTTWRYPDKDIDRAKAYRDKMVMMQDISNNYNDDKDEVKFKVASRDYISKTSDWNADSKNRSASKDESILQTGIYSNAQPIRFKLKDKDVMLFLTDDTARNSLDRTSLVYSILDKETNTWSEPKAVDNDRQADFSPQVITEGDKAYIVWQNSSKVFDTDTPELEEWIKNSEIKVAEFKEDGTIDDASIKTISEKGKMAISPKVSSTNNGISVIWCENEKGNFSGGFLGTKLYKTTLKNGQWTKPEVVVSSDKNIISYDLGNLDGNNAISYSVDMDSSNETIDDREVFLKENGKEPIQLTSNEVIDSNPQFGKLNNKDSLLWYADNGLVYITSANDQPHNLNDTSLIAMSDNYKILNGNNGETSILTIMPDENGNKNVYAANFNSESDKLDNYMNVTKVDGQVLDYSAIVNEAGGYDFSLITCKDDLDDVSLSTKNIYPYTDLSVNKASVDESSVVGGGKVPVSIKLSNNGLDSIEKVKVTITNSKGDKTDEIVDVNLLKGEEKEIQWDVQVPNPLVTDSCEIKVEPVELEDINSSDNSKTIKIGAIDLKLDISEAEINNKYVVNGTISNNSEISSNATLKIREDSVDGKVIKTEHFKDLTKTSNGVFNYSIDLDKLNYNKDGLKRIYFTIEGDGYEEEKENNTECILLCNEEIREEYKESLEKIVSLNTNSLSINKNEDYSLEAYIINGEDNETIKWESSNEDVATVDENGKIHGVGGGVADITASINGTEISDKCTVYVNEKQEEVQEGNNIDTELFENSLSVSSGNIIVNGFGSMNLGSTNINTSDGLEGVFIGSKVNPYNISNKVYKNIKFKDKVSMIDEINPSSIKDLVTKAEWLDNENSVEGVGKFAYKDYTIILANVGEMQNGKFAPGDINVGEKFSLENFDKTIIITNGNLNLNSVIINGTESSIFANKISVNGVASINLIGSVASSDAYSGRGLSEDETKELIDKINVFLK